VLSAFPKLLPMITPKLRLSMLVSQRNKALFAAVDFHLALPATAQARGTRALQAKVAKTY
jgi:hypothetical protein